ncbi:MAG: LysE family translocator [Alphaproteobacteria bacterium]|nr:LysE family translocator [Alphaproteobacteria bacterium]
MQYLDLIITYSIFVFATSGTPGPNNIMVAASGANFGVRATLPHVFGIRIGLVVMMVLVGLGLGEMFRIYPSIHQVMRYIGIGFMLYLSYRIAVTKRSNPDEVGRNKPISFLYASLFQWVNPKAWITLISAIVTFIPADGDKLTIMAIMAIMIVVHFIVGFPATLAWALFGREIGRLLKSDRAFVIFNYFMAGLLILTIFTLFL